MATRIDVARRARVSSTTVTGILNGNPRIRVSPGTRRRVLATAQRLGYVPNVLAQGLNKRLNHIGVVVRHMYDPEHGLGEGLLEGIGKACESRGFFPVLCSLQTELGDVEGTARGLREFLASRRVSGLIIDKEGIPCDSVATLAGWEYPFVLVNGSIPPCGAMIYGVNVNDFEAGRIATKHLIDRGHRRIGMITRRGFCRLSNTGLRTYVDNMRRDGYWAALAEASIEHEEEMIQEGDSHDKAKVYDALSHLLALRNPPTAILAADDRIALAALHGLSRRGLIAPRDVAVVAIGDTKLAALCEPALTAVRLPIQAMTELAVDMLLRLIARQTVSPPHVMLDVELVVREST